MAWPPSRCSLAACGSSSGSGQVRLGRLRPKLTASAPGITATTITIGSHQPLTGIAAPGYDEIAPASNAYFQYVNAHGGIYGRKIVYKYLNDQYNPSMTSTVVRQLVLKDNVYAIFDGLGTPTHLAVAPFLNSEKVPDVFVASGCECWNDPAKLPETFGWQLDYVREGKILGQYVKDHFKGKKIGYLLPERRVRPGRRQGPGRRDPGQADRGQGGLRPDQHHDRPAGGQAQGGRRPGRGLVLGAGLHRAAQAQRARA